MSVKYYRGHSFLTLNAVTIFFTRSELALLHLHVFHPSSDKLFRLFCRADTIKSTTGVKIMLDDITQGFAECKEFSARPYRFRVSVSPEKIVFNEEVAMDFL